MTKIYLFVAGLLLTTWASAQTYCTAGPSSTADSEIINVQLTGDNYTISNLLSCPGAAGVQDFTGTDSADVSRGTGYTLNVTFGTCGGTYTGFGRAWADWNDDGDFDDAGEELGSWGPASPLGSTSTTYNGVFSFQVPMTATLGQTRLRVMQRESGSTTSTTPCATFTWGAVEDYTLNVTNTPPACPTPGSLATNNVGPNGATLKWVSTGSAFNIEYGLNGFTLGNGTSTTATTDSVVISGLAPATIYQFYVQNNCSASSNGTSNWAGPFTFLTGCAAFTTPFTEGFDNVSTGNTGSASEPTCWTYYETPGHAGWGYTYSSSFNTSYTAPNMFYFYNSSNITDSIILASPEIIGLDSSSKQVVFYVKTNTSSYDSPMIVGTMSDPNVPSSFNTIATVTATQNWQEFIVALDSASGYNGTDKHLAFMYKNTNSFDQCYLDNITVEAIPPCPKPNLLMAGTTTSSTADLSWTSGGSQFVIEYGPTGFTQGTGNLDTVQTSSATLMNLASNTTYDAYILNDCSGAGNGVSVWAGPITFTTLCSALSTPISEGFESAATGGFNNNTVPDCWFYQRTSTAPFGYVINFSGYPRTGTQCYRFYSSSLQTNGDTSMLISPEIADMDNTGKRIEFWARSYSTSTAYDCELVVGTVSNPNDLSSFVPMDTFNIGNNTTYQYFQTYFDAANGYNGTHRYIAIMDNSDNFDYTVVDDITISNIPQCTPSSALTVGNITNNSAVPSWTAGDGLSYQVEYGPTGFTQGTGPVVTGITSTNLAIAGLNSNTCYDVYVRDSCATGLSPWFGPITFCTLCDAQAVPYSEGFDGVTASNSTINPGMPDCWFYYKSPQHPGYGYTYSFLTPNSAPNHFRMYNSSSLADTLAIISPAIQGMNNGDLLVKFWASSNTTSYNSPVIIGTMGSPNDPSSLNILDTVEANSGYAEYTVYLDTASGYNGTDQHVVLMHGNGGTFRSLYLDDIMIEQIPSCTAPWNIAASNLTASAATIDWSTLQGTCFKIEYGPTGFIQGTGNGTTISNTTSPTTITGLNPNTFYDVYVADCCDSTSFNGPITFKTECTSQLSGSYTVGGATSDFATLDSAFAVLTGCGVSAPVSFLLQGGTHAIGGKYLPGSISGISATNTVTFIGGGVAVDTILFTSGTFGFDFEGGHHFTFQNMTINGAAMQRTVWLHEGANNITFDGCHIWNNPTATSSTSGVIVGSGSATSNFTAGDNADHITVTDCKLVGGYTGIWIYGVGTSSYNEGFVVEDNEFADQSTYAIRFYYAKDISIKRNMVTTAMNYSIYNAYFDDFEIEQNHLQGTTYALYMSYANSYRTDTPSVKSTVKNNFVTASGFYASYLYSGRHMDFVHNSINGTGTYGQYVSGTSTYPSFEINFINNIFVGGSNYALYGFNTTFSNVMFDHNIYHTTGGTSICYWGTAYTNLAAWQAADTNYNASSLEGDPGFLSSSDLHIVGTLPNDQGMNGFATVDIDGDTRPASGSTNVDMGADEFTPLNWDASLETMMVSLGGCGDSNTTIDFVVKNFGLNTITSLPLTVNITGGITANVNTTATVNIPQGATDTVNVGTFSTYNGAVGVMFEGFTGLVGDQKSNNDTMMVGPGSYIPAEPVTPGITDSVCASVDSIDLWTIEFPGTNMAWWDAASGGNKIANGDTVTVATAGPTTYWVQYDSATANPQVGAGTAASATTFPPTITPYKTYYMDGRVQYLILASEMAALGVAGGGEINSLAFEVALPSANALSDFTIKVGGTSVSAMTGTYQPTAGMTTVYNVPSYTTTAGWNVHTFTTPYIWNGADNILVEVCYDNNAWTTNSTVYYSTTSFTSVTDGYSDLSASSGCTPGGITNQVATSDRPNMQFNIKTLACSQVRKPISFVVSPDSAYASFTHTVQTNGADVDFDASASSGQVYTWDFGDGSSGSGMMTSHTYATADTWTVCLTVEDTSCGAIDSICETVISTIGIEESLINQTMNVYPNPNNGDFRVEFQVEGLKNVELRVVTLLGQVVYESKPGNVSGTYREEIKLSDEATGVYILQLVTEEGTISRRVTVRK